jgi:hypothetical protein
VAIAAGLPVAGLAGVALLAGLALGAATRRGSG